MNQTGDGMNYEFESDGRGQISQLARRGHQ